MTLRLEFVIPMHSEIPHFLVRCCEGADLDANLCTPTEGFEITRTQDNSWRLRGSYGPLINGGKIYYAGTPFVEEELDAHGRIELRCPKCLEIYVITKKQYDKAYAEWTEERGRRS